MTIEEAAAFIARIKSDVDLQARVRAGTDRVVVDIAAEAGHTFSTQDYEAALRAAIREEHPTKEPGELTLDELAAVSGGIGYVETSTEPPAGS